MLSGDGGKKVELFFGCLIKVAVSFLAALSLYRNIAKWHWKKIFIRD